MAAVLVPDGLWDLIQPLLSPAKLEAKGGRPRVPDRACLKGILFVLRSGIPWEMLPKELGCGSGMTCWRRLRDWQAAGIWDLIHFALLDWLSRYSRIDWSRKAYEFAGLGLAATSSANTAAALRTFPAIVMSASERTLFRQCLKPCADIVEMIDFVQDRLKKHGQTTLLLKSLRWENFRWTGLGQKT